jgi:hypothetical protein
VRQNLVIALVTVACVAYAAVPLGVYYFQFGGQPLSDDPQHWGVFGDYVAGTLNPSFAIINLAVVIYIAFQLQHLEGKREQEAREMQEATETARRQSEQRLNAVRLLDTVYSLQFHKEVAAPVWEIFVKWRHWRGEQGNLYRLDASRGSSRFPISTAISKGRMSCRCPDIK